MSSNRVALLLSCIVSAATLSACATSTQRGDGARDGSGQLGSQVAYQARIALVPADKPLDDWTDIVVTGGGEAQKHACELLLKDELDRLRKTTPASWVARACALPPLPPAVGSSPSLITRLISKDRPHLLADRRIVTDADMTLVGALSGEPPPEGADSSESDTVAEVTRFSRYPSEAACEEVQGPRWNAKGEAGHRTIVTAYHFFEGQIRALEIEQRTAEEESRNLKSKCDSLRTGADAMWACRGVQELPPRCLALKSELESCEASKRAAEARRRSAYQTSEFFRERKGNLKEPKVIAPVCRRE